MNSPYPYYFDANASYGPTPAVLKIVAELQVLGFNPNSAHSRGQGARAGIESARSSLRTFLGAGENDTIFFNSGASEGNNAVVTNYARGAGTSIVTDAAEHSSILAPAERIAPNGTEVRVVPVNGQGVVAVDDVIGVVDHTTTLVSLMAANNETGYRLPLDKIIPAIRRAAPNAVIHSDAVQVLGKVPFSMRDADIDIVTLSGHKFGALSGVGAIALREGIQLNPYIVGGPQEQKLRAGTENVLGILSIGAAAEECMLEKSDRGARMRTFRDRFESEVVSKISGAQINCAEQDRIPNTCSVYIPGVRTDDLLVALDREGISVSAGAACSSGTPKPSHVLKAMGQDLERIRSTLRVSFRADHAEADLSIAFSKFIECVERCLPRA